MIQRVTEASVETDSAIVGSIGPGLLILLGIATGDTPEQADYLVTRAVSLRIFSDENGRMNRSVAEVGGSVLVVSQFTLYGDCSKGNRPSYDRAASAEAARPLYEYFITKLRSTGIPVESGIFQAAMQVRLLNDGPVTIICDSK